MNYQRLKILFDIFLNTEDKEDIREYFISQGEDPDAIIEQAKNFVKKKKEEIILKSLESRKN